MDLTVLSAFLGRLRNDVKARSRGGDLAEPEAFVSEVLDRLEEQHHVEESHVVFYEKPRTKVGPVRIYGWSVNEEHVEGDDEKSQPPVEVTLVTAIYAEHLEPVPVTKSALNDAGKRAVNAWKLAIDEHHKELDQSGESFAMFQRIHEIHGRVKNLRILILTDGVAGVKELDSINLDGIRVSYDVWDLTRLSRLDEDEQGEEIEVDFEELGELLPCLQVPVAAEEYCTWLAIVPGSHIHTLYRKYGLRLLQRNVRSFLQARGKVNRGIRETLRAQPGRFLAYNNGLSAIASEVVMVQLPEGGNAIKSVKGLQIVNGGQTTASIFHGADLHPKSLFGLYVQLKLTRISPQFVDEIAPKIAEYANTQNPIRQTDLTASAPFHIELEQLAQSTWTPDKRSKWFYERARGSYENRLSQARAAKKTLKEFSEEWPKAQRFTKAEVAAWMNVWPDSGDPLPYEVSLGGEKNHAKWFKRYIDDQPVVDESPFKPDEKFFKRLIARGIVFRAMEKIAKERFDAHRNNIVAYTIGLFVDRQRATVDLDEIWERQEAPADIIHWLSDNASPVDRAIRSSAGSKNVGEWSKKRDCWDAVKAQPNSSLRVVGRKRR
jgi:hypothetical protein